MHTHTWLNGGFRSFWFYLLSSYATLNSLLWSNELISSKPIQTYGMFLLHQGVAEPHARRCTACFRVSFCFLFGNSCSACNICCCCCRCCWLAFEPGRLLPALTTHTYKVRRSLFRRSSTIVSPAGNHITNGSSSGNVDVCWKLWQQHQQSDVANTLSAPTSRQSEDLHQVMFNKSCLKHIRSSPTCRPVLLT